MYLKTTDMLGEVHIQQSLLVDVEKDRIFNARLAEGLGVRLHVVFILKKICNFEEKMKGGEKQLRTFVLLVQYNLIIKLGGRMRIKCAEKENLPSSRERKRRVRGQFDPEIVFDEQYINARVEAFQKYREKQAPLRVL